MYFILLFYYFVIIYSIWIPFTQWCFVPSMVEIDPVVLKKEILSMYFRYIISISPWKRGTFHLNKFESSPKDTLCQFWLKLAQWFWRRRRICEKYKTATTTTTTTTTMTNNGQQSEKLTWAFGSGELKAIEWVYLYVCMCMWARPGKMSLNVNSYQICPHKSWITKSHVCFYHFIRLL